MKVSVVVVLGIVCLLLCMPAMAAVNKAADDPPAILSIADAASKGIIGNYCYIWHECDRQYQPVGPTEQTFIEPWTGFWVIVYNNVDLLFPKSSYHNAPDVMDYPPSVKHDLLHNHWYLLSAPLVSSVGGDFDANFGDELGSGLYEQQWRVAKWNYATGSYMPYLGPGTGFPEMIPGRGFWIHQKYGVTKTIAFNGVGANPPGSYYEVKLPVGNSQSTLHMVGNPFWYAIKWKECKVRVPMTSTLPIGKVATSSLEDIEMWFVDLSLDSVVDDAKDTYNRAGVLTNFCGDTSCFNAIDMQPPGDYVRIALTDPLNPEKGKLAYDYRPIGESKYSWNVELTTSYKSVDVVFSLDNIIAVPDNYAVSLIDRDTQTKYDISTTTSIPLTLSSASAKTYRLEITETVPVAVDALERPAQFGIQGVSPNPFNPVTTIDYGIEQAGNVRINIYNLNGQMVDSIVDGFMEAGQHRIDWNARDAASGVYIVSLNAGNRHDVRKVTLVK